MAELGTVGTARVRVKVDFRGLRTELSRAVKQTQTGLGGIRTAQLSSDLKSFGRNANTAFATSTRGASRFSSALLDIRAILPTLTAGFAIKSFFEFGDAAIRLRNRVRLVTDSSEEFRQVQDRLFATAQATRSELESTTKLYSRLRLFTDEATFSSDQLFKVTKLMGQAFRVSGAQAREAAGATIQFTQGIGSNKLGGEELRSVLEQGQRLAQALADGLNETGVAMKALGREAKVGDLKQLNEKGLLTAVNVIGALLTQAGKVEKEFGNVEKSVSDAFTLLRNQLLRSIGLLDEGTGATKALIGAIGGIESFVASAAFDIIFTGLSEAIAFATRNANLLLAALVVFGAGRLGQGIANLVTNIVAKVTALNAAKFAALNSARADVTSAQAANASAAADLRAAQAARVKAVGRVSVVAATRSVAAAEAASVVTSTALVGATGRLRNASIAATKSMRLLGGAMAFFGGPVGLAVAGLAAGMSLLGFAMFQAGKQASSLRDRIAEVVQEAKGPAEVIKGLIVEQEAALKKLDDRIASIRQNTRDAARDNGLIRTLSNDLETEAFRSSRPSGLQEFKTVGVGGFETAEPIEDDVLGNVEVTNEEFAKLIKDRSGLASDLKRLNDKLAKVTAGPEGFIPPEGGTGNADKEKTAIVDLIQKKQELLAMNRLEGVSLEKLKASIALTAAERRDDRKATVTEKATLEDLIVKIFEEGEARDALKEAQEKAKELHEDISGIEAEQQALRELIAALKESEEEYKIVAEQQAILSKNQDIGAEKAREMAMTTVDLQDELDKLKDKGGDASDAFQELGATFSSAFEDAVVEAQKLTDVLDALVKDLFRIAFRKLATEPIFGGLADELGKGEDEGGFDGFNLLDKLTGGLFGGSDDDEKTGGAATDLEIEDLKRARTIESLDELSTAGKSAAATVTNMSGTAEGAANVLTGTLAAGAIETGVANKVQAGSIQGATAALLEFTIAVQAAAAAAGALGGSSLGSSLGGGPGSNLITNSFGTFSGAAGRAEGGLVAGPGSGKSDSILSRLSNGEFVVNSQATSQNLPALEALNRGGNLPSGDTIFNIDGSGDPEAVAAEVALMLQRTQGLTPRQHARGNLRSARRLSGDGF